MQVKDSVRSVAWVTFAAAAFAAGFCVGESAEELRMRPLMALVKKDIDSAKKRIEATRWRLAGLLRRNGLDSGRACDDEPLREALRLRAIDGDAHPPRATNY